MRKLLRYELMQSYLPLVVISLAFLVCMLGISLILRNTHHYDSAGLVSFVFGICVTGAVVLGLLLVVAQILLIISTFGKNLFGDYGYLLFCVPVGIDTILLAKILNCFILIGASLSFFAFVGVGSALIMVDADLNDFALTMSRQIVGIFSHFDGRSAFATLYGITLIFGSTLQFLMYIFLTLALLNIWRVSSFRFVLGLLLFFGIAICGSIVSSLLGLGLAAVFSGVDWSIARHLGGRSVDIEMWLVYAYMLCTYLLLSGVCYLLARWCIIKKLELE